jgi:membrane fusion protein (multidrug efflux system)
MLKKILVTAFGLLVIIALLGGIKGMQIAALIAAGSNQVLPAETVTSATAKNDVWENTVTAVGTLVAVQGVNVAAESPGKIVEINFESGAPVKRGDVLLKQDTSVEEAQLRSAEASAALARLNLDRSRALIEKHTISQAEVDTTDAQFKQANAQADNFRAMIAKKTIRAPFTGRLGIRLVNLGQNLKEGDPVVSLQALDPIFANFSVPQQELGDLAPGLVVRIQGDAVEAAAIEGKITAISPDIDPATRSVRVQATLTNKDGVLHPGMFVNVSVVLPKAAHVLIVPATAILYAPYGDSVFVIEEKKGPGGAMQQVVRQQFVRIGSHRGDFVALTSGLKSGETIVSTGVFKLRNGGTVNVDNTLAPDAQLAPKPDNS